MICARLSIARTIGCPFSPTAETASANKTLKATICRTSPRAIASIMLDGNACTIVPTKVCGCACEICLTMSMFSLARVTPAPGFVKFTTASPMKSAAVVAISKKISALIPIRPTFFKAPPPAILWMMFLSHLACSACGKQLDWQRLQNLCTTCGKPPLAIVDLVAAGREFTREKLAARERSLWRYRELLPLPEKAEPISLGEGGTPLLQSKRFGPELNVD